MHSNDHEFSKPASPSVPYMNDSELQIQTRFDGTPNKTIYVTSLNHARTPFDLPEESCDSFIDIEEASVSLPGKPMKDGSETYHHSFMAALSYDQDLRNQKRDQYEPYHRMQKSTNVSPHQELNELMKTVDTKKSIFEFEAPLSPKEPSIDLLTLDPPRIEIIEEPETTYRARYESEGCKGPIHGASETGFPSVKIVGYVGPVKLQVFVVTSDLEPHLHAATGPGSSKTTCEEICLDDQYKTPAIEMTITPTDNKDEMVAVFDQLSIRRIRNFEADRELRKRGIEPASWKSKKKEAKLAFRAKIPCTNLHPNYVITSFSRSFLCTAPSGNPEIWWISKTESYAEGGDELGFIGKKFASGFKVRFFSREDDGNSWEVYADIDKTKSNLNACVVRIPPYKDTLLKENAVIHVEIRVGSDKEPRCSEPFLFTYITKAAERCQNCTQIKSYLKKICNGETADLSSSPENLDIKTEVQSPVRKIVSTPKPSPQRQPVQSPAVVKSAHPHNPNSLLNIAPNLKTLLRTQTIPNSPVANLMTMPSSGSSLKSVAVIAPSSSVPLCLPSTKVVQGLPKPALPNANVSILPTLFQNSQPQISTQIYNAMQPTLQTTVPIAAPTPANNLMVSYQTVNQPVQVHQIKSSLPSNSPINQIFTTQQFTDKSNSTSCFHAESSLNKARTSLHSELSDTPAPTTNLNTISKYV
eukprot:TCONS_00017420-protein